MKIVSVVAAALALTSGVAVGAPAAPCPELLSLTEMKTGTTLVLPKRCAVIDAPKLDLPAGLTIVFADDVTEVRWQVGMLNLGKGVILDLSYPTKPEFEVLPTRERRRAGGSIGFAGESGRPGRDGRLLDLKVGEVASTGSLWIRTDGESGHAGQPGHAGGKGVSATCDGAREGGTGGKGGEGGTGGRGGNTSRVTLDFGKPPNGPVLIKSICNPLLFPSTSPSETLSNDGVVVVSGAPGPGGTGGAGGLGGEAGDGRQCKVLGVFGGPNGKPGRAGESGRVGQSGEAGRCAQPEVKPIEAHGHLSLASMARFPSWKIAPNTTISCSNLPITTAWESIEWAGKVNLSCAPSDLSGGHVPLIRARRLLFDSAAVQCAPAWDLIFESEEIRLRGANAFQCDGSNGQDGANGPDGRGWCVARDRSYDPSAAERDYNAAGVDRGGNGGNGGDGWPGNDVFLSTHHLIADPTSSLEVRSKGGAGGRGGQGGRGGGKGLAPSSDDCRNGTNFIATASGPNGSNGSPGAPGRDGVFELLAGTVEGTPTIRSQSGTVLSKWQDPDLSAVVAEASEAARIEIVRRVLAATPTAAPRGAPRGRFDYRDVKGAENASDVQVFIWQKALETTHRQIIWLPADGPTE